MVLNTLEKATEKVEKIYFTQLKKMTVFEIQNFELYFEESIPEYGPSGVKGSLILRMRKREKPLTDLEAENIYYLIHLSEE